MTRKTTIVSGNEIAGESRNEREQEEQKRLLSHPPTERTNYQETRTNRRNPLPTVCDHTDEELISFIHDAFIFFPMVLGHRSYHLIRIGNSARIEGYSWKDIQQLALMISQREGVGNLGLDVITDRLTWGYNLGSVNISK